MVYLVKYSRVSWQLEDEARSASAARSFVKPNMSAFEAEAGQTHQCVLVSF